MDLLLFLLPTLLDGDLINYYKIEIYKFIKKFDILFMFKTFKI